MAKTDRPKDANQLAKLVVNIATGEETNDQPESTKNPAAVALGRLGGLKGGKARANSLTPEQRKEIAQESGGENDGRRRTNYYPQIKTIATTCLVFYVNVDKIQGELSHFFITSSTSSINCFKCALPRSVKSW